MLVVRVWKSRYGRDFIGMDWKFWNDLLQVMQKSDRSVSGMRKISP
jgi:ABC-type polysaccharide/polyol phosphate export permease